MPQIPLKRTVVSMRDYARAVVRTWKTQEPALPIKQSVAVLWAQYMIETGGAACWNWNIGNVKHVQGDGYDYHELQGVWEGVSPFLAEELFKTGQAVPDTREEHAIAVGPNRVPVIFKPPHPATQFRAYGSLEVAMSGHLAFLKHHYGAGWDAVLAGDYKAFAKALKSKGYFTASEDAYARGMAGHFAAFCGRTFFEEEMAALLSEMDKPTLEALPDGPVSDKVIIPEPITDTVMVIHPPVPLGRDSLDAVCGNEYEPGKQCELLAGHSGSCGMLP